MSDADSRLNDAADRAEAGADIIEQVANGGDAVEVPTASGPRPSLAKWFSDRYAEFYAWAALILADCLSALSLTQSARDAAMLNAGLYQDISAGLVATSNGDFFSVPSADPHEYVILYKNNSGVAVEQGRYPSAQAAIDAVTASSEAIEQADRAESQAAAAENSANIAAAAVSGSVNTFFAATKAAAVALALGLDDGATVETDRDEAATPAGVRTRRTVAGGVLSAIVSFFTTAMVAWKHGGTGAVWRTLYARLMDLPVSVKDFGILGDGSDEYAKLTAAFAVIGNGVKLTLNGLNIKTSIAVSITGKSGFQIDGMGGSISAVDGMAVASGKGLLYLTDCENFKVENINFDGNRANRTAAEVAAHTVTIFACRKFIFENVTSNNAVVDGFYFGSTDNTDTSTYCRHFRMVNCFADNCYRQGASVVSAYDFQFIGGAYTNTSGAAPQAGIDVEANIGATVGNARGLFKGVSFIGNTGAGLLLTDNYGSRSFRVKDCYFSDNDFGGLLAYAEDTHVVRCEFTNHSGSPSGAYAGILTFPAASATKGCSAFGNVFHGNTASVFCIYIGAGATSVLVHGNTVLDNVNGGGISNVGGNLAMIKNNKLFSCGGIGISNTGADSSIEGNIIDGATGRGIYDAGARVNIKDNKVYNITTVSGGFIQAAGSDTRVVDNLCSSTLVVSDIGIRVDSTAMRVSGNICVNLNSTDPYGFVTTGNDEMVYNNVGGTANERRKVKFGMAPPSYTTGARPAATSVAIGQGIFNTTTLRPNYSNGTAWYNADGTAA